MKLLTFLWQVIPPTLLAIGFVLWLLELPKAPFMPFAIAAIIFGWMVTWQALNRR